MFFTKGESFLKENKMITGSIPKAMLTFAGPYLLTIIVQNLYGAVDLFVVGQFATTADVSAVTIGSQLMSMVTQLIIGFATGTTVLVGQYYGAKNEEGLSEVTGTSITIFTVAALAITAGFMFCYNFFIGLMQTPAEAVSATGDYIFMCTIGIVFIVGFNIISSILMGLGDTKTPFLFIIVACIINVVLDVILVKYVGLGAMGAAIATSAAQAGSVIFSLLYLKRKGLGYSFQLKNLKPTKRMVGRIIKIGGPVAIQNIMVGISFLFITAIINKMGLTRSAAVGVVEKLINFLFMPAIAFGAAVSTVSAQNIGAGKPDRAKKSMWYGILMALIPSVIVVLISQFFGQVLTSIFTSDPEVQFIAADYLRSYVMDTILVSFVFAMNGYFNSSGYSWFTLLHSLLTTFALRIPLSYLFSLSGSESLYGIGWAAPISSLVSVIMCLIFLALIERKRKNKKAITE